MVTGAEGGLDTLIPFSHFTKQLRNPGISGLLAASHMVH